MRPIRTLFVFILVAVLQPVLSQKVVFLHHSTGWGVYSEGNVSGWIETYNSDHGTSYQMTEKSYPNTPYPWNNYPYDYWNLWINNACNNSEPGIQCLNDLCASYNVIIFKHCFPGADISADDPTSLVSSSKMTIGNYKLQYRALRDLMDTYPDNKFIVWTLAPLHRLATYPSTAARAKEFVDWVKNEWLQEDGKEHSNIYIFDFYNYVAETDPSPANGLVNCLKYDYEVDHASMDSHPNIIANQTVGPLFAEFIVNTIEDQGSVHVNSISVTGEGEATTISTDKGTLQLNAAILPADATNKTVTWSIQDGTGNASINASGLVTAIANGTVTAWATANDGSGVYGTLTITITNQTVLVTGITVTGAEGANTITTDNGTLQLNATITPEDASNKEVTWSVQNETGQASIDASGLVTAIVNGTVTARATANDGSGVYGTLTITITNQIVLVTGITVTGAGGANTITTDNGTLQLNVVITPEDASNKEVTWSVQNETGQAEISQEGILTAISDGDIVAKATSMDGSNISGIFNVTISNQLLTGIAPDLDGKASIRINQSLINIELNKNTPYEQIKIYSISGSPLIIRNITSLNEVVDVSQLMPGVYILVLSGKGETLTKKVVLH
jgi:uncharacterized protein YjdB